MSTTGLPFDDIRDLVRRMPGPDVAAVNAKREREAQLTKPAGALGRMEELSEWLAAWQGRQPAVRRPLVAVFAGNHGVTRQGVSPFPPEVTAQMVSNFAAGGAAINQICAAYDLGLKVFDLALEVPTKDITEEAAVDERTCAATMAFGMEVLAGEPDLLCIGEMGIGNTTAAAALCAKALGGGAGEWVGPGTGLDPAGVARKIGVIEAALVFHQVAPSTPFETLRRLGGREIAAMAGAIVRARQLRVPVLLDGFICCAAIAPIFAAEPAIVDHCLAGHCSAEPGHKRLLERFGLAPLLTLGMRLGEGSGAAVAAQIVRSALAAHNQMATFAEAGVAAGV